MMIKDLVIQSKSRDTLSHEIYNLLEETEIRTQWRWISDQTSLLFENPYKTCKVYLECWIPMPIFKPANGIHVVLNAYELDYLIPQSNQFFIYYELPVHILGAEEHVRLELSFDSPNYILFPDNEDRRTCLGMIVKRLFIK